LQNYKPPVKELKAIYGKKKESKNNCPGEAVVYLSFEETVELKNMLLYIYHFISNSSPGVFRVKWFSLRGV
jgi:type III secretory pathway lipoprotein EscJ